MHLEKTQHMMTWDVIVLVLLCLKTHFLKCEKKERPTEKNNQYTKEGLCRSHKQIVGQAFSSSFNGEKTIRINCCCFFDKNISGNVSGISPISYPGMSEILVTTTKLYTNARQ